MGTLRVVEKDHIGKQHFLDVEDATLPPLNASSVRVKPRLLGLQGSSNLSYCVNGHRFHWWDTFPVPKPLGNDDKYGIAPCWGFAEVTTSTIKDLPSGSTMWGFMPTHSCAVDLELRQSQELATHWIEVSEHRSKVMALYNRYIVVDNALTSNFVESAWRSSSGSIWECGYLMNRFNFPSSSEDHVIHPMPDFGDKWSPKQGDLRSAVVICLGAGGKTSKSFVHQLATNRLLGTGPVGLLEVSSTTKSVLTAFQLSFEHRTVRYADAVSPELLDWIIGLGVRRVVMINMGSRDNIVERLSSYLREEAPDKQLDMIAVGGEMKIPSAAEMAQGQALHARLKITQLNTSGIRTEAIKQLGEAAYFEQMTGEFEHVVQSELARNDDTPDEGKVLGTTLKVGEGIRGPDGLEKAWSDICNGVGGGDTGLAFRV